MPDPARDHDGGARRGIEGFAAAVRMLEGQMQAALEQDQDLLAQRMHLPMWPVALAGRDRDQRAAGGRIVVDLLPEIWPHRQDRDAAGAVEPQIGGFKIEMAHGAVASSWNLDQVLR